jgi:Sap, sulfolipid-1-addressing protein
VDFLKILPMAFVMIAGPQILSAIFLATSENWRRNSAAYVFGAALSISAFVTIAFLIGGGIRPDDGSSDTLYIIVLLLLVAAAIHVYLKREESEPPKWMGKLQNATPRFSFTLGLLLLGVFPTDIFTSFAVGSYLANKSDSLLQALPFVALTLLFLATPALLVIALRERGQVLLPKIRDWMNSNAWIVNEIVIGLFIVLTLNSLLG